MQASHEPQALHIGRTEVKPERSSDDPVEAASSGSLFSVLLEMCTGDFSRLNRIVRAAIRSDLTVLVTGETGTGKELVAQTIHQRSHRRAKPFVAVNCGALPRDLVESELFGYKRGAFTGAGEHAEGLIRSASGGTLFLDEVGEMPLEVQVKLLRALQHGTVRPVGDTREFDVDVRIVAATNQDLARTTSDGRFRADLFYRLNVLRVELPPLRAQLDNLPRLVTFFRERARQRLQLDVAPEFSGAAWKALQSHNWPGNLRELENVIEVGMAVAETNVIDLACLPSYLQSTPEPAAPLADGVPTIREMRDRMVIDVLERVGNNKSKAARILGVSRSRLYSILEEQRRK